MEILPLALHKHPQLPKVCQCLIGQLVLLFFRDLSVRHHREKTCQFIELIGHMLK